ncbi:MAG: hypothetical protein WC833_04200 [Bacteroidales bacterium]|jgi:hypothetical protein
MENKQKINIESIRTLLDRYFNGETTLQEEETLRNYFSRSDIDPEFKQYSPLFNYFSQEKNEMDANSRDTAFMRKQAPANSFRKHMFSKKLFFSTFSLSAAAAIAIFTFIHWPDQQKGVEMMIGGERIKNEQFAISKTDEQLTRISNMMGIVGQNASSLRKLNNVEKSLSIISKK